MNHLTISTIDTGKSNQTLYELLVFPNDDFIILDFQKVIGARRETVMDYQGMINIEDARHLLYFLKAWLEQIESKRQF